MTDNNTEVDKISYLPENLIDSILEKFAKNGAFGHNGFVRITNQIFYFLKGPLLKLHLHIPNMVLDDSFQEVDQWISSLSRDGVIRELVLTNSNQPYQLPCYFFRFLELRKLELENRIIKPPLNFQGFQYLENLSLRYIEFGANLHGNVINLPQLKKLHMVSCTNVYNFKIKSPSLYKLLVMDCPDSTLLQLLNSKCLGGIGIVFLKPIQGVERVNLDNLLSNMLCLGDLFIDGYFLQYDFENVKF
ncbi:uncharacterized protein [Rutidosis leptorrhynchoides]|uniref:uncharacterized protein n=1 Tax=Rutidosis leptorrhynchoides TaxID=125765 RepID=UPI003A99CDE4